MDKKESSLLFELVRFLLASWLCYVVSKLNYPQHWQK